MMEINFCDRCDAAIPQADLDNGIARDKGGVMTCALCMDKTRSGLNPWHVLVPLGLLASAFLGALSAVLVLGPRISTLERSMGTVEVELETALEPDPALAGELRALRKAQVEQAERIEGLGTTTTAGLESVAGALRKAAAVSEEIAAEISGIKEHLRTSGTVPAEPAPPGEDDDLEYLLGLTGDADPGKRLSAFVELKDSEDPRVVAKAIEALVDPDMHVRAQAASLLGTRKSREAVPKLIELLNDAQAIVRAAAHRALKATSGKEFGYDPTDDAETRAKAVQAWREWWVVEGLE